jgi:hypothetical protein
VRWLFNGTIDDQGYNTAKHFVRFRKLKLLILKNIICLTTFVRQNVSQTGRQPSLVIPNNASPPKLRTAAAVQSVNIDGSGLKIQKRKREKECVKFPSIQF